MIVVHDTFVCKPGNAGKAAKMFKESMGGMPEFKMVMTDLTGKYHRVIMVTEYDSLAAWEKAQEAYMNPTPEMKKSMENFKDFQDMYTTGKREIYKVW